MFAKNCLFFQIIIFTLVMFLHHNLLMRTYIISDTAKSLFTKQGDIFGPTDVLGDLIKSDSDPLQIDDNSFFFLLDIHDDVDSTATYELAASSYSFSVEDEDLSFDDENVLTKLSSLYLSEDELTIHY